ncbi:25S rRNA (cytosine-C(5))-methyltransferase rcm1 [Frankliniella fusca]|uniref:25S rRNA (Cytosine-C(5))-methyltransferase rcm1 n=1 Tax=Frankliniella fusca TaxID=407009 RepID=A0AAE1LTG4_9NEOP|nr:25S rRNA (cytosine-C(5))-methyltransferase rcm1 [Frankliniella fusca]
MAETKFRHSTARVPRLYKEAGRIVQKVREEGGSFKGLVFQTKQRSLLKSLYALVAETLRHGSELDAMLRKTQILIKEPRLDPWLTRVLITDLLMFTLPFIAFFATKQYLRDHLHVIGFAQTAWSVAASVIVVNLIVFTYVWRAFSEPIDPPESESTEGLSEHSENDKKTD